MLCKYREQFHTLRAQSPLQCIQYIHRFSSLAFSCIAGAHLFVSFHNILRCEKLIGGKKFLECTISRNVYSTAHIYTFRPLWKWTDKNVSLFFSKKTEPMHNIILLQVEWWRMLILLMSSIRGFFSISRQNHKYEFVRLLKSLRFTGNCSCRLSFVLFLPFIVVIICVFFSSLSPFRVTQKKSTYIEMAWRARGLYVYLS